MSFNWVAAVGGWVRDFIELNSYSTRQQDGPSMGRWEGIKLKSKTRQWGTSSYLRGLSIQILVSIKVNFHIGVISLVLFLSTFFPIKFPWVKLEILWAVEYIHLQNIDLRCYPNTVLGKDQQEAPSNMQTLNYIHDFPGKVFHLERQFIVLASTCSFCSVFH